MDIFYISNFLLCHNRKWMFQWNSSFLHGRITVRGAHLKKIHPKKVIFGSTVRNLKLTF